MNLINRFKRSRRIHRAIRELSELNDDTLRDIGIERGNIGSIRCGREPGLSLDAHFDFAGQDL